MSRKGCWIISLGVSLAVFVADIFVVPLGVAGGVPYVLVFLFASNHSRVLNLGVLAAVLSAMVVFGYIGSPRTEDIPEWIILTNRALAIIAIWAAFGLSTMRIRSCRRAQAAQKQLLDNKLSHQRQLQEVRREFEVRLIHAQRMQSLNETVSALAHQLAQPLSTILTYAEPLREDIEKGRVDRNDLQYVSARVVEAAHTAQRIITSVRNKIRRREPTFESADLNHLISHALDLIAPEIQKHRIELTTVYQTRLPAICCDAIQIEQVVVNLLQNAIDSLRQVEAQRRKLEIETTSVGEQLLFTIRDTGKGLPHLEPGRIFEPFYTTNPEGTGLGLPICQSVIKMHGGRIDAKPNAPSGAEFKVWLPLDR